MKEENKLAIVFLGMILLVVIPLSVLDIHILRNTPLEERHRIPIEAYCANPEKFPNAEIIYYPSGIDYHEIPINNKTLPWIQDYCCKIEHNESWCEAHE